MVARISSLAPIAGLVSLALAGTPETCPTNLPLSCHNSTAVSNTCCFVAAGQLLQTQFWDTDPATGPSNSWTIHGLWPDYCDGSYPSSCDPNRAYTNITEILQAAGANSTLTYMNKYWKNDPSDGTDESFWEHEWEKHGTCISTLDPSCYTDYTPGEEAVDFFNKVVATFKTLPTYSWLSAAGISPDSSKQYALSDILSALSKQHGAQVAVDCEDGALNQVSYGFNAQGSLQTGTLVAADAPSPSGSCSDQVKYVPKTGGSSKRRIRV